MNLYNMRSAGTGYSITKFDQDLNPLHSYTMASPTACTCPQARNRNAWCRHLDMARRFLGLDRVDTGWFYCYETSKWHIFEREYEEGMNPIHDAEFGMKP